MDDGITLTPTNPSTEISPDLVWVKEYENGTRIHYRGLQVHREDGPAIELPFKEEWYFNGERHRIGGPAVTWKKDGTQNEWWVGGKRLTKEAYDAKYPTRYLENGPKGTEERWYLGDRLHREDGPALDLSSGYQEWCLFGNLHREDGPAVIDDRGELWYYHGKHYSEQQFKDKFPLPVKGADGTVKWWLGKLLHRENGPAIEYACGDKMWFYQGSLHRENGPAVMISGKHEWHHHGKLHREDGPAILDLTTGDASWYQNGILHRNDGPAIDFEGDKRWYRHGKLHREDGPAVEKKYYKEWWVNGLRHRTDGPACELSSGAFEWYFEGALHRDDGGPSWHSSTGSKKWHKHGKLHRIGGPAVVYASGGQEWWVEGVAYTEEEYKKKYPIQTTRDDGSEEWRLNGELHREDGPAVTFADGSQVWMVRGHRHRIGGPAFICQNGTEEWWVDGDLHRENGPAVTLADGTEEWWKEWWVDGEYHREDGPAIERTDGSKEWYFKGVLHRIGGPALEGIREEWWVEGVEYTEEEYKKKYPICTTLETGTKEWRLGERLHRVGGPAVEYLNGDVEWWVLGKLHRVDGPAKKLTSLGIEEWWLEGVLHREDGPAATVGNIQEWWVFGKKHREDGPAEIIGWGGPSWKLWWFEGQQHREDGPAEIRPDGSELWYRQNQLHREDGPAYVNKSDGFEAWYRQNQLHREGAPAVVRDRGSNDWYHEGTYYSEEEYKAKFPICTISGGVEKWELNGVLHRDTGPAYIEQEGVIQWWAHGKLHREDGPAVVWDHEGTRIENWCFHGKTHRVDGPAVIGQEPGSSFQHWYHEGQLHRVDGPAVERWSGQEIISEMFYLEGVNYSAEEHAKRVAPPTILPQAVTRTQRILNQVASHTVDALLRDIGAGMGLPMDNPAVRMCVYVAIFEILSRLEGTASAQMTVERLVESVCIQGMKDFLQSLKETIQAHPSALEPYVTHALEDPRLRKDVILEMTEVREKDPV